MPVPIEPDGTGRNALSYAGRLQNALEQCNIDKQTFNRSLPDGNNN